MPKVLVVGDATVDQMYFVEEFPEPGGEVSAHRAMLEPGGSGGTVATVLARLGNDVRIATRVGTGPFAELALRNAVRAGVDTALVQRDAERATSSVTLIVTPDAQRTMISAPGASRHLEVAALRDSDVAGSDALVLSAYSLIGGPQKEYALRTLALAAQHAVTVFVDLGTAAVLTVGESLLDHVAAADYLLMNEYELYAVTGEATITDAVAHLRRRGCKNLVVKVGENGSLLFTGTHTELVEAHEVDGVVDSTGAGDYYTAAFAHAVLRGEEVLDAARMANVAGALNTTKVGAQTVEFDAETLQLAGAALATAPA